MRFITTGILGPLSAVVWSRVSATATLTFAMAGCVHTNSEPPARAASPDRVLLAQPCGELKTVASTSAPVGVFLQVASVQSSLAEPLDTYLRANAVQVDQVASMLVKVGEPAVAPWRSCTDVECTAEQDGTIKAALLDDNHLSQVELVVTLPNRSPERVLLALSDQQPQAVALSKTGFVEQSVVVTPYVIRHPEQASLQTLYRCKLRAHEG